MWDDFSKRTVFTLPNAISFFRLLTIPFYSYLFLLETNPQAHTIACVLLGVSCISDMFDGFIARRTNTVTLVGKILDPLADKFTQFSLLILITLKYNQMFPIILVFLVKEIFQLCAGVYYFRKGKMLTGALLAGKISTTVLFTTCLAILWLQPIDPQKINWIVLIDFTVLTFSFLSYIGVYFFRKEFIIRIDFQP